MRQFLRKIGGWCAFEITMPQFLNTGGGGCDFERQFLRTIGG